jgi:16S rRNA (cytosine967-C5)-methyltransferase
MTDTNRTHALEILQQVLHGRQPLDAAVAGHSALARTDGPSQAFARRLVTTTIRHLGQIDDAIAQSLDRPLRAKARTAHDILRLGAAQILFMEIPDHAAVDTSVRLFKAVGEGGFAKLVNAVLRRLTREGGGWVRDQDAARLNTPDWLWNSWSAAYGEETCRRIAEAHLCSPPLDISVKSDPEGWAAKFGGNVLPGGSVRLYQPDAVSALAGYDEGEWWVQDTAAKLISSLIGDVRGKRVIDLCAAPGGKTACLINSGAQVSAVDRSANRLKRLQANMKRLNFDPEIIEADAATWRPQELADAVLLDAPCSATGTLRRHPDVAYGKSEADIAKLTALQLRLLDAASEMVKPGGIVLFVTCSLQVDEGPAICEAARHTVSSLTPSSFSSDDIPLADDLLSVDGTFRSLPCHLSDLGGMDGFFASRFARL